jgi:DNA-binding transcriptional MerR regulator
VGANIRFGNIVMTVAVTPATVRYYSRIGLLSQNREPENGYRCFTVIDLKRVEFVRQAQKLGLKIGDIKSILDTAEHGEILCGQVRTLVR